VQCHKNDFCSLFVAATHALLQRDETRRVSGTNTRTTVVNGGVSKRELTKIVTNHLRLDLNSVENLAVVDADDRADHLGGDDLVAAVGLDLGRLLTLNGLLLGLEDLLHEDLVLYLDLARAVATSASAEHVVHLLLTEGQELVELHTAELECTESTTGRGCRGWGGFSRHC